MERRFNLSLFVSLMLHGILLFVLSLWTDSHFRTAITPLPGTVRKVEVVSIEPDDMRFAHSALAFATERGERFGGPNASPARQVSQQPVPSRDRLPAPSAVTPADAAVVVRDEPFDLDLVADESQAAPAMRVDPLSVDVSSTGPMRDERLVIDVSPVRSMRDARRSVDLSPVGSLRNDALSVDPSSAGSTREAPGPVEGASPMRASSPPAPSDGVGATEAGPRLSDAEGVPPARPPEHDPLLVAAVAVAPPEPSVDHVLFHGSSAPQKHDSAGRYPDTTLSRDPIGPPDDPTRPFNDPAQPFDEPPRLSHVPARASDESARFAADDPPIPAQGAMSPTRAPDPMPADGALEASVASLPANASPWEPETPPASPASSSAPERRLDALPPPAGREPESSPEQTSPRVEEPVLLTAASPPPMDTVDPVTSPRDPPVIDPLGEEGEYWLGDGAIVSVSPETTRRFDTEDALVPTAGSVAGAWEVSRVPDDKARLTPVPRALVYPEGLHELEWEGMLLVRVWPDWDGRVSRWEVERPRGHPEIAEAIEEVVDEWRFAVHPAWALGGRQPPAVVIRLTPGE